MKTFKYFTEAKMSRQHFQLVARKFATALASTNPGFKEATFMAAYKKSPGGIGPQG